MCSQLVSAAQCWFRNSTNQSFYLREFNQVDFFHTAVKHSVAQRTWSCIYSTKQFTEDIWQKPNLLVLLYFWRHMTPCSIIFSLSISFLICKIKLSSSQETKTDFYYISFYNQNFPRFIMCWEGFMSPGNLSELPLHHFKNKWAPLRG